MNWFAKEFLFVRSRTNFELQMQRGENGFFVGMGDVVIIGRADGGADILTQEGAAPPPETDDGLFDDLE